MADKNQFMLKLTLESFIPFRYIFHDNTCIVRLERDRLTQDQIVRKLRSLVDPRKMRCIVIPKNIYMFLRLLCQVSSGQLRLLKATDII